MRLRNRLVRLLVPLTLIATSAVLGGWKWETFPH
jgi:hypothetical protein